MRRGDDERRLAYTLAACFLGRLCLSGDVCELSDARWDFVRAALRLYPVAAPAIRDGVIRRHGVVSSSHRHPRGWQGVTFATADLVVAVLHTFAGAPAEMTVPLPPEGDRRVTEVFPATTAAADGEVRDGLIRWRDAGDFSGRVILLRRTN